MELQTMTNTAQSPGVNTFAEEQAASGDEKLVSAAQSGSSEAFEEIQRIYSQRLYRTILSITRVPEDAEDALQDTFLRAFAALPKFEGRSTLYSWLTRIATNCALMILRKRRVRCEVSLEPPNDPADNHTHFEIADNAPNPEQIYDQRQRQVRLARAIGNLEPILRTPIQIQMNHGWTVKQIGRALAVSDAAVKTRLHRARQKISKTIGFGPVIAYQHTHPSLFTTSRTVG
jgi:RNA polymerase sigma-70 factor (ECF subfamily)